MRPRDAELARQRAALLRRSARLRNQMGRQLGDGLAPVWRTADAAHRGWQWLRRNPWVWAIGAFALAAVRPARAARTASRAWGAWIMVRRLAPLVTTLLQIGAGGTRSTGSRKG